MIQNISIACDAVIGAGSENFGTITGFVTFKDGSANSGVVNGDAIFEGNAIHRASASVTGNATFAFTAQQAGAVGYCNIMQGIRYIDDSANPKDWKMDRLRMSDVPPIAQIRGIRLSEFDDTQNGYIFISMALASYPSEMVFSPAQWVKIRTVFGLPSYNGIYIMDFGSVTRAAFNSEGLPYSGTVQIGDNPYTDENGFLQSNPIYFPDDGSGGYNFVNGR